MHKHVDTVDIYRLLVAERVLRPLTSGSDAINLHDNSPVTRAVFSNQIMQQQNGAMHQTVLPIMEAEQVWGAIDIHAKRRYDDSDLDNFSLLIQHSVRFLLISQTYSGC